MKYQVSFRPLAEADLLNLYEYIAAESGSGTDGAYLQRIEAACLTLESFPERGTRRDDLVPGIRILGFERRVAIAFRVRQRTVEIVRIFYGGQNYESVLRARGDE